MSADLPTNCNEYTGPTFEPDKWNDGGQCQNNNNCYNYGCNTRTHTFAQPGRGGGFQPSGLDCISYSQASEADGLSSIECKQNCPDSL